MSLTHREMARLGELLDEALVLTPEQRCAWVDSLPSGDQPLVRTLCDALLAEESGAEGPLDRPPRIGTGGVEEEGATSRHAGQRLGAYELLRPLGSGGMAEVWLAGRIDGAFERQVALKIPRLDNRPVEMTARFALECNILAGLEHPGIARLYDAGVDASCVPYIAMEYVQGEPLVAWCEARGLDEAARIQMFLQLLDVVAYAHGRQVVHRDLKPSNILVTGDGEVRLLDFGTARLLQPETDAAPLTRLRPRPSKRNSPRHIWRVHSFCSAIRPGIGRPPRYEKCVPHSSWIRTLAITNSPGSITTSASKILPSERFRRRSRSIQPAASWQRTTFRITASCIALTSS